MSNLEVAMSGLLTIAVETTENEGNSLREESERWVLVEDLDAVFTDVKAQELAKT